MTVLLTVLLIVARLCCFRTVGMLRICRASDCTCQILRCHRAEELIHMTSCLMSTYDKIVIDWFESALKVSLTPIKLIPGWVPCASNPRYLRYFNTHNIMSTLVTNFHPLEVLD